MANNPQQDDKRYPGDPSDESQPKRPNPDQDKAGQAPQRTPGDHRPDQGQDDGMKRPTEKRDYADR